MGVMSSGEHYDIAKGLMVSFPVTCAGGEYSIVDNLTVSEFGKGQIAASVAELLQESETAKSILNA